VSKKMMLLVASVVVVVLGAAATALAASPNASNHSATKGTSAKTNKDFAGLVDIGGGRQMYMECRGKGRPTVVFVAGAGDRPERWSTTLDPSGEPVFPSDEAVLPAIAQTNRVCAYDRPGTILPTGPDPEDFERSRSDPVDQPTTLQEGVDDLHALLSPSGERGPYVLVGHSAGGAIAELYASQYPQEVSGLVLIDYTAYAMRTALTDEQWELYRALNTLESEEDLEWFEPQRSMEQTLAAAPLKPMPLIVFSADEPLDLLPFVENGSLQTTPEEAKEFGELLFRAFVAARSDLVSQVPGARHITDTDSGHYIHVEHPKLVTAAVREVVDAAAVGSTTLGDTGGPPIVSALTLAASLALFVSSLAVMRYLLRGSASS
jgi:pimeloyl-ACP methyl ester carboxylesterase